MAVEQAGSPQSRLSVILGHCAIAKIVQEEARKSFAEVLVDVERTASILREEG